MTSTRAVAYTRVSTGKQAESGLGLDDQRQAIENATTRRGWDIVRWTTDAGASAKSLRRRPGLAEALELLDAGEADVLNAEDVQTARGGRWHASTVSHVLKSVALDEKLAAAR